MTADIIYLHAYRIKKRMQQEEREREWHGDVPPDVFEAQSRDFHEDQDNWSECPF